MVYDLRGLFEGVRRRLAHNPALELADVAADLKVERHTIEGAVREVTGKSFRRFRRDIRLQVALDALTSRPEQSIKEIAFHAGFRSTQAFARFIRKAYGCSPTDLRRGLNPAGDSPRFVK